MLRLFWAVLGASFFAGCMPGEPAFEVKTFNAASMVLVSVDPLEVLAVEPGGQAYVAIPPGRQRELYVLRYPCSLKVLGMAPGVQPLIGIGGRPLPETTDLSHVTLGISELEPVEVWPSLLTDLRLDLHQELGTPCLSFDTTSRELADTDQPYTRVLLAYPDDRGMVIDTHGRVRSIDVTGVEDVTSLGVSLIGGYRAESGRTIFTSSAASWIGSVEDGLGPMIPFSDPDSFGMVIDGDPLGDLGELFAVTSSGSFYRFDGSAWELLRAGDPTLNASVVWLGDQHAVAVGVTLGIVVEYDHGALKNHNLPPLMTGDEPTVLGWFPDQGLALGTQSGLVFIEKEPTRWERVEGTFESHVRDIHAYRGSLFHGGRAGTFSQYRPDHGACETVNIGAGDTKFMVRVEHGFIAVTEGPEDSEIGVVAIDNTPEAQVCEAP